MDLRLEEAQHVQLIYRVQRIALFLTIPIRPNKKKQSESSFGDFVFEKSFRKESIENFSFPDSLLPPSTIRRLGCYKLWNENRDVNVAELIRWRRHLIRNPIGYTLIRNAKNPLLNSVEPTLDSPVDPHLDWHRGPRSESQWCSAVKLSSRFCLHFTASVWCYRSPVIWPYLSIFEQWIHYTYEIHIEWLLEIYISCILS